MSKMQPELPRIDALGIIEANERRCHERLARLDYLKARGLQTIADCFERLGIAAELGQLAFDKKRAAAEREWEGLQRESRKAKSEGAKR